MRLTIPVPSRFSFERTLFSHGWCVLKPFELDRPRRILTRVLELPSGQIVTAQIAGNANSIIIKTSDRVPPGDAVALRQAVRHMLRLDDNMDGFYKLVGGDRQFSWIAEQGA